MSDVGELLGRLKAEQLAAVEHDGDTVVLAGPGSGKTDTIVLKVALLLHRDVPPPRGVACITYGNDAVREFSIRLRHLGLREGQRLFLGTVHSFCLNRVLRPFANLVGRPELARPRVLSPVEQRRAVRRSFEAVGAGEEPRYFDVTLTRIRRAIACGEPLDPFDESHVAVAEHFNAQLAAEQAIDFEAMTLEALRIVQTSEDVRDVLVARYPWIAVDEYQDLGGPLHQIVNELGGAGSKIFAVGDPDQCIHAYTGADPSYLEDLAQHETFRTIHLSFNYRSGARLIAAAEATLASVRNYQPDPHRDDEGDIEFEEVHGGLEGQAEWVGRAQHRPRTGVSRNRAPRDRRAVQGNRTIVRCTPGRDRWSAPAVPRRKKTPGFRRHRSCAGCNDAPRRLSGAKTPTGSPIWRRPTRTYSPSQASTTIR